MGISRCGLTVFMILTILAANAAGAGHPPPEDWDYAVEPKQLRGDVQLLIDGEAVLDGRISFPGGTRESRLEGEFRGHDVLVRCRRNPIVSAFNCFVRVDGEVRSNHVVMQ